MSPEQRQRCGSWRILRPATGDRFLSQRRPLFRRWFLIHRDLIDRVVRRPSCLRDPAARSSRFGRVAERTGAQTVINARIINGIGKV